MTTSNTRAQEVFYANFVVEPHRIEQVVKAVLGAILFYRSLGNAEPTENDDCVGVTMPSLAADSEGAQLVEERAQAVAHQLGATTGVADYNTLRKDRTSTARIVVALYPTPLPISTASLTASGVALPVTSATYPSSSNAAGSSSSSSSPRPSASSNNSSRSRGLPSATSAAATATATATGAVTSALGWFSASAKALTAGTEERDRRHSGVGTTSRTTTTTIAEGTTGEDSGDGTAQVEAIWGFEKVWETWVVDVQVVEDARRSRNAVAGGGGGGTSGSSPDERLRQQVNDFALRAIDFVMRKTAHVPPITSAELRPFGIRILIDPPVLPIAGSLPEISDPKPDQAGLLDSFPRLHSALAGSVDQT